MTDLPNCKLCGKAPIAFEGIHCPDGKCPCFRLECTVDEWITLNTDHISDAGKMDENSIYRLGVRDGRKQVIDEFKELMQIKGCDCE